MIPPGTSPQGSRAAAPQEGSQTATPTAGAATAALPVDLPPVRVPSPSLPLKPSSARSTTSQGSGARGSAARAGVSRPLTPEDAEFACAPARSASMPTLPARAGDRSGGASPVFAPAPLPQRPPTPDMSPTPKQAAASQVRQAPSPSSSAVSSQMSSHRGPSPLPPRRMAALAASDDEQEDRSGYYRTWGGAASGASESGSDGSSLPSWRGGHKSAGEEHIEQFAATYEFRFPEIEPKHPSQDALERSLEYAMRMPLPRRQPASSPASRASRGTRVSRTTGASSGAPSTPASGAAMPFSPGTPARRLGTGDQRSSERTYTSTSTMEDSDVQPSPQLKAVLKQGQRAMSSETRRARESARGAPEAPVPPQRSHRRVPSDISEATDENAVSPGGGRVHLRSHSASRPTRPQQQGHAARSPAPPSPPLSRPAWHTAMSADDEDEQVEPASMEPASPTSSAAVSQPLAVRFGVLGDALESSRPRSKQPASTATPSSSMRQLPRRPAPQASSEASSEAWSAPLPADDQRPPSGSSGGRSSEAERLGIPSLALADVGSFKRAGPPDEGTFAMALGKLTEVLYKSADWMDSARSGSTIGSDWGFRRRTFREDSDIDEPLSQRSARQAMAAATDHVFGKEDAVEMCELYFDAPYEQTDLGAFREEMQDGLAHAGLPEEHMANLSIDFEPGSIVARMVGPVPTIDVLARLPLRGMKVLGYPACFSRDEFAQLYKSLELDRCPTPDDTPFCHSKGGSASGTPSSTQSSLYRKRLARPRPAELEVLADEMVTERSTGRRSVGTSRSGDSQQSYQRRRNACADSAASSERSSVMGVFPPPMPAGSLSSLSNKPSDCEILQMASEVGLRVGEHQEQAAQELLEGMAGVLYDGEAPPDAAMRVLSGLSRPSASDLDEVARRVAAQPGGGGAREQKNIRLVLTQITDGMFGEDDSAGSGLPSPVLHTARSSIRSGASASASSQDFNFDAHACMMELACTVLTPDVQ